MLRLRRRALALADEEEQADAVHHAGHALAPRTAEGSSKETTGPDTVVLLPSSAALGNFTKEIDLKRTGIKDPKAARLLAEKTREIWEVPCQDNMEECVTALAMLLQVVEEKITAPVSVVVEGISTKRSCYHVTIMLQLSGSSRTASLFLKNMGRIYVGCFPFSVDSGRVFY
nr:uncharacterized protein LOC117834430 [Setaria viridis]